MHWLEIIKDDEKKEIEIAFWKQKNENLQEELGLMKQSKDVICLINDYINVSL